MKKFTLFFLFAITFYGLSAQNILTVKISYVMNKTNPPSYTFSTDFAGEASNYLWYFGDEGKSEQVSPTYTFKYTKNYVVTVKILGKNNEIYYGKLEGAFEGAGILTTACKAYFTFARSITSAGTVAPKKITFTNQSTGEIKECKWSFGDSLTSTDKNPVHEFRAFGEYKVCLIITTTNGCKSDYCTTVKLTDPSLPVIITAKGTVKDMSAIAGCGLVIVVENSTVLIPVEIASDFKLVAGQYVELAYEVLQNSVTACQAGKPVKIHKISVISVTPSCKANFTWIAGSNAAGTVINPKKVTFTNKSTGTIRECVWTFGDETKSNELNPVHEYAKPGEYKVCLLIVTTDGCRSDYCAVIKVTDPSTPVLISAKGYVKDLSATSGCKWGIVLENGSLLLPVEMMTDFVFKADQKVEFIYEVLPNPATTCQSGKTVKIHRITEITTTTTCKAYFIFSVISSSNTDDYDKKKVSFTNKSTGDITKCVWTFGDGTESNEMNPVHAYAAFGEYKVCLHITTAAGCTSSYCTAVKLTDPAVPVIISAKGYVKDLSDLAGCKYVIVLEDGTVLLPVIMVPNFTLVAGQKVELAYEVLTNTITNCQTGKPVKVHKISEIPATAVCKAYFTATNDLWSNPAMMKKMVFTNHSTGEIKECKWTFGDGTTSNELRPIHEYPGFGEYKACLLIVTTSGCRSEYCATVLVDSLGSVNTCNFDLVAKKKEQTNNVFVFYAVSKTEIKAWKWSFGDEVTSTAQNPEHTYEKPGTYVVTCTIVTPDGCTATRSTKVTVSEPSLPACPGAISLTLFEPGPDLTVCNGKAIVSLLNESGKPYEGVTYGWSNGMTGETATNLCPNKQYIVKALIPGVCQKFTSFTFLTSPVWKVTNTDGKYGFAVQSPADSIIYRWDFGDGNFAFGSSVEYDFENEGIYDVTLTAISGSYSNGSTQKVAALGELTHITEISPSELKIYPNPTRDVLTIEFGKTVSGNLDVEVINMSGQKVIARKIGMSSDYTISMETSFLSPGIYLLRIMQENQVLSGMKFQKIR